MIQEALDLHAGRTASGRPLRLVKSSRRQSLQFVCTELDRIFQHS